jgi:mediator of RNA polymerase II transcription subunit 12
MNLTNAYRDAAGNVVYGSPVLNRPWEWVENLGEPPSLDPKEEEKEREEKERLKTRYLVKNSGSLSLETFSARITGDGVITGYKDTREESNVRSFEDGLSAESIFKRDWREARVSLEGTAVLNHTRTRGEEDGQAAMSLSSQGRMEKRPALRESPASSVLSRGSAHISASGSSLSRRTSPGQSLNRSSTSTASEPIDVDTVSAMTKPSTSNQTEKRKIGAESDDEVEIVEGPIPIKKPRTKSSKVRGKKR